jgi:hypothetical protein
MFKDALFFDAARIFICCVMQYGLNGVKHRTTVTLVPSTALACFKAQRTPAQDTAHPVPRQQNQNWLTVWLVASPPR